jgi:hypothetical protein
MVSNIFLVRILYKWNGDEETTIYKALGGSICKYSYTKAKETTNQEEERGKNLSPELLLSLSIDLYMNWSTNAKGPCTRTKRGNLERVGLTLFAARHI